MALTVLLLVLTPVMMHNASFEVCDANDRPGGWSWTAHTFNGEDTSYECDARLAYEGRRALRLSHRELNFSYIFQRVSVHPRSLYHVSCRTLSSSDAGGPAEAGLAVGRPPRIVALNSGNSTAWDRIDGYFKTGVGVSAVDIALTLGSYATPTVGTAWFDDVSMEEVSEIPTGARILVIKRHHIARTSVWRAYPAMTVFLLGVVAAGPVIIWLLLRRERRSGSSTRGTWPSPRIAFVAFGCFTLLLWLVLLHAVGQPLGHHATADQHTRQALAWREGRVSFENSPDNFELAPFAGRYYVSFPPVPTLFELPLTFFFGQSTPNTLILLVFSWLSMLVCARLVFDLTRDLWLGFLGAFAHLWGTNTLGLSLNGVVWSQGQMFGFFFMTLSLWLAVDRRSRSGPLLSGLALGLAVGCRPLHLSALPLLALLAFRARRSWRDALMVPAGAAPPLLAYAAYNFARFGSLIEFGHAYLPWSRQLPHGIFSVVYLPGHLQRAFLKLPLWDAGRSILGFSDAGTAFWATSPVMILGLFFFFVPRVDRVEKLVGFASLATHWLALLIHESTGGTQFGYRYLIDLVPLLVYFFGRAFRRPKVWLVPIVQYSVAMNVYGAFWLYNLRWMP